MTNKQLSRHFGSFLAEEIRVLCESEEPITQAHIDASYKKVVAAHRAHEKAANSGAGYSNRRGHNGPADMNRADDRIRKLQDKHHSAAKAHKELLKRFEAQSNR